MVQSARLVGPAIAGVLIYEFGEGLCFLIDGVSYLGVIAALLAMRIAHAVRSTPHPPVAAALRQGVAYAFGFAPIRSMLALVATISLMAMSQSVLMPIYADEIMGGRERTLGMLLGSAGLGALCGSLYLASRRSVIGLGRMIVVGAVALGIAFMALAASSYLALSIVALLVAGAALLVQTAAINTLLQTIVDDDKRGRVMSLFAMAFMGMAPFGSLLAGAVATEIGIRWTLASAGGVCLVAGGVFALHLKAIRPLIRPIYLRKGILPLVLADAQAPTDIPAVDLAAAEAAAESRQARREAR